jgi:TatD DNase family protein
MLVDTHAHLQSSEFRADLPEVIRRSRLAEVRHVVVVGTNPSDSAEAVGIASRFPEAMATVGIHPSEADTVPLPSALDEIERLAKQPRVVGIGEIGLDFYRHGGSARRQHEVLEAQLELAARAGLPVVIHCRRALRQLGATLGSWRERLPGGIMHCFPGGIEEARLFLRMGFLLGVGGTVTFPKSRLPDVLRRVGLDGVVLETDCPYLAPVPRRGRRNEPSYLRFVAERIASELGVSSSEVESSTTENACRLFNLPVPPLADGGPSDALT